MPPSPTKTYVKRVLVRLFLELHNNEHREVDGQSRRPRTTLDPRQRIRDENTHRTHVDTAVLSLLDTSGQTRKALMKKLMCILQISRDSCEVNWRRCQLELMICPTICRVFSKLENAAMELSAVPGALVTVRAARDKMKGKSEGKGELAVSFSGKGKGKWRKPNSAKHVQDKLAARKSKSKRGHWAGDPQWPGTRDTNFTTCQMNQCCQIVRTTEPSRWLSVLNSVFLFKYA